LEKVEINTLGSSSEILIGAKWESVGERIPGQGVAIITDTNVHRIYGSRFPDFPVFKIKPGEESKKLEVIELLAERLIGAGIDRTGFILGIGGGVVCDVSGFLASIYMRGIRCAYISSTLLSQVDASTGGKNGVNLGGIKNVLGCFRQPEFVICDPSMLQTLPEEEYFSGVAELIKTAVIGDARLFETIESNHGAILKRDPTLLSMLVSKAVSFKAAIVSEDEKESGLRRILNFGHTYGHAIELYKSFKHGYAVASGMELAARFSVSRGYISDTELKRVTELLKSFRLLRRHDIPDDQITQLLMHDKKKSGTDIYFVFLEGIGNAVAEKIPLSEVIDFYRLNKPEN
jgi:3-dehydroquinate synthase